MTRQFCIKCICKLKKLGVHEITVANNKSRKIVCWKCDKKTYGRECNIKRKGVKRV